MLEERVKLAKHIKRQFVRKELPFDIAILAIAALELVLFKFIKNEIACIVSAIVLLIGIGVLLGIVNMLDNASKIMYSRALVGKQISANPVSEGIQRYRDFGGRRLWSYRRKCGRVMYFVAAGAMSFGEMMENIPYVKNVAGIYKKIVKRIYEESASILVLYQLGCYENADEDQFYDLVTYFIQDGKNFLKKIVKIEAIKAVWRTIGTVLAGAALLMYFVTSNKLFIPLAIAIWVIEIIVTPGSNYMELLCGYIEYVQSHPLNTALRDKIALGIKSGSKILDFTREVTGVSEQRLRRAVGGSHGMTDNYNYSDTDRRY